MFFRQLGTADTFDIIAKEQMIFGAEAWSEALVLAELNRHDRYYLGAFTDPICQELIGYAGLRLGTDTDLMTVGVVEQYRGFGVGKALLRALLHDLDFIWLEAGGHWFIEPGHIPAELSGPVHLSQREVDDSLPEAAATPTTPAEQNREDSQTSTDFTGHIADSSPVVVTSSCDSGIEPSRRRVQRIILEVRQSNHSAQNLYRQLGFKEVSRIKRYYRQPLEDAVVMIRQNPHQGL
ncbi:MAG: GNAT family N-acetyltransferase [Actinomycetaceae bacterium]|nr:GNAT family N-acetyltransferase [Actinomycetaceae bacterium]